MKIAKKTVLKAKPYTPGKPIEELQRELGLRNVIKLASNENALGPSAKSLGSAKRALLTANRYPDSGSFYLKKALARQLGVKQENLIIGNGSDEIIVLAIRAFLKGKEEVIIAKPTFLIYEIASGIEGARIKYAPLKDLKYDVKKIASLITRRTKIIFIANPDNPTGTYITDDEMRFLVSRVPENVIIFFDEAYYEFARGVSDYADTMRYFGKKNVIITRSFSKIHSLAGLRVGYGMANKKIIECLNKTREPFNVNSVAQAAAMAALDDKMHVKKSLALCEKGKDYFYSAFNEMNIFYVPSVTNFILFKTKLDSKKVYRALLKKGVIIREMSAWKLNGFLRVTVGTMTENRKFIKSLREIMK